jgi:hypothetical protein
VEFDKSKIEFFANKCRGVVPGGAGGACHPKILADQFDSYLTLSQPGEADYAY